MSVHRGVSASVHAGIPTPPPGPGTPLQEQTPPGADTPQDQAPPPGSRHPPGSRPPREADCSIRLTSGRYESYWNAFLSIICSYQYKSCNELTYSSLDRTHFCICRCKGSFTLRRQWHIYSIYFAFRCRFSVNTTTCSWLNDSFSHPPLE